MSKVAVGRALCRESEFTWILDLGTSKTTKKCHQMRFLQNTALTFDPPVSPHLAGSAVTASGSPWSWLPLGTVQRHVSLGTVQRHPSLHVLRSRGSFPQPHRPRALDPLAPHQTLRVVTHVHQP